MDDDDDDDDDGGGDEWIMMMIMGTDGMRVYSTVRELPLSYYWQTFV